MLLMANFANKNPIEYPLVQSTHVTGVTVLVEGPMSILWGPVGISHTF